MKPTRKQKTSGGGRSVRAPAKAVKPKKLRVIGGEMRGRAIAYHGESFTRPMKDNIRENLFNILGRRMRGSICFDLFAGTGALSFESLSRGAISAVAIEQDRRAVAFMQKTADTLGVADRISLRTGDTFRLAPQLLMPPDDDTPWVVFLSPPYALWTDRLDDLNRIIQTTLTHAPLGSVVVVETEKTFDADRLTKGSWDFRIYGGTRLGFIEPEVQCGLNL